MKNSDMAKDVKTRLDRPVVLTGMMGTGKSHVGRLLAIALDLPFADSDRLIEEDAGCTVAEIFSRDGEERFRVAEKKAVLGLLSKGTMIVATGGGALMDTETRDAVFSKTVTIWLKSDPKLLAERLDKATNRPLLSGGDKVATLEKLLAAREPVYRQANIAIDTVEGSVERTTEETLKALHKFLKD
jgi:shikimate kinase